MEKEENKCCCEESKKCNCTEGNKECNCAEENKKCDSTEENKEKNCDPCCCEDSSKEKKKEKKKDKGQVKKLKEEVELLKEKYGLDKFRFGCKRKFNIYPFNLFKFMQGILKRVRDESVLSALNFVICVIRKKKDVISLEELENSKLQKYVMLYEGDRL